MSDIRGFDSHSASRNSRDADVAKPSSIRGKEHSAAANLSLTSGDADPSASPLGQNTAHTNARQSDVPKDSRSLSSSERGAHVDSNTHANSAPYFKSKTGEGDIWREVESQIMNASPVSPKGDQKSGHMDANSASSSVIAGARSVKPGIDSPQRSGTDKDHPVLLTSGQTADTVDLVHDDQFGKDQKPAADAKESVPEESIGQDLKRTVSEILLGCCQCCPLRFLMVAMVFLGMIIINAMRTNVGVTVLTILDKDTHRVNNDTGYVREIPNVNWSSEMIGYLHSIFYVGYMVTNLPGAYLTTRLPSHSLFGGCILLSCVLNLTMPLAIQLAGFNVTLIVRLFQGFSEGLLYPACYGILRFWSTPSERSRVGSLVLTGAYIGPIIGFPLAGIITDYMGWQYIYYVNGGMGVIFVFIWLWLSQEKPSHHKMISKKELDFIEEMQGSDRIDYEGIPIPWFNILTSLPVAALCICHFARNWVFILMLTNEPNFLNIFHFSIAENGLYSALPHVLKTSTSLFSGYVADYMITNHWANTSYTRKFLTGGFGFQSFFFILLTLTTHGGVAMIFLTFAIGFGGFAVSGWQLNHYDLSARHASVLVGVTSTFGNIASIASPLVTGVLTKNMSFTGWNDVFYITAGITGLAFLSFLVFGSGEKQSWAMPADVSKLVIKPDAKRRTGHSDRSSNSSPVSFIYSKLREDSEGQAVVSHDVPNYGSQQSTSHAELPPDITATGARVAGTS